MGGFSESDLVVLTNTLSHDLSDYVEPGVELMVSPVSNAVLPATQLTCLHLPTPDAITPSKGYGGHIQPSTLRILRARAYLVPLAFCRPSPPDHMRVISGTGRGALAFFFASYESSFKVPSGCYTIASNRVWGLTAECTSHVRKCPRRCNEAPSESRRSGSSSTVSSTSMSRERSTTVMLMNHIPGTLALGTSSSSTIGLSTCL
jgi:hypothetical protein